MARSRSRLAAEIDFDRDGKQHGFIRLPYSVHRSAYGWIPIPIAAVGRGAGPRVLLMAGNHGDELEGQVALGKLIRELQPGEVRGHVIILPSANFPAAMAGYPIISVNGGYAHGLPVGISFMGTAFSEPTLIKLASGFEAVTRARRAPKFISSLPLPKGVSAFSAKALQRAQLTRHALERRIEMLPRTFRNRLRGVL